MKSTHIASVFSLCCLLTAPAMAQITGGTCSASNLSGPYQLMLTGRIITTTGGLNSVFNGIGTATFDGISKVTFAGISNSATVTGQAFSYTGTYTVPSNCYGSITFTSGSAATLTLVVWSSGQQFDVSGTDPSSGSTPVFVYGGSGSNPTPVACATPTLSGTYTYDLIGTTLSGTAEHDAANESGVIVFDGQGNVTSDTYALSGSETAAAAGSATGTYTITSSCLASVALKDSKGNARTFNFAINGVNGQNLKAMEASSAFIGSGNAHSAFYYNPPITPGNAAQSINNVASYAVNATPAGSVFVIFGQNLATKAVPAGSVPLPNMLLTTTVTVNGEIAPLFSVGPTQIDAQMPWDIPGNTVASVIVKNTGANGSTSNAGAVYVPAGGTPGISFFTVNSSNRAAVINADGVTTNTSSTPAAVGDIVTLYFTGGGPVNASGKLITGAGSPAGLSPVTDPNASVTVGGVTAVPKYIGLSPGSVGLYQADFVVPQIAKGTYPVVITIDGVASNSLGGAAPNPVMSVSN